MAITAQNSIVISRIRNGDLLTLALSSDKSLSQYYSRDENDDVTDISPDWSIAGNQPTIGTDISSTLDSSAYLKNMVWTANGSTPSSSTYRVNSDGSLTIIGNVASNNNTSNVLLKFTATAVANGVETTVSRDAEVQVVLKGGANSYDLWLYSDDGVINTSDDEITIRASLTKDGSVISSNVTYKWYFNQVQDTSISATSTTHTVTKDDINGSTLVTVAALYNGTEVATRSVTILDYTDPLIIKLNATNGASIESSSDTSTISVSVASGDFSVSNFTSVKYDVYRTDLESPIRSETGTGAKTITITSNDSDYLWVSDGDGGYVKSNTISYSEIVVLATVTI